MMARWRWRRPVRKWMKIRVRSWEVEVGVVAVVGVGVGGLGDCEGGVAFVVLSSSWDMVERIWVERVEGRVRGRFVRSFTVALGERAPVCVWGVWFSLGFLDSFCRSSEVVLSGPSGSEQLSSGGSVSDLLVFRDIVTKGSFSD